jgi:hypothetical protein
MKKSTWSPRWGDLLVLKYATFYHYRSHYGCPSEDDLSGKGQGRVKWERAVSSILLVCVSLLAR